jgi:hypothetical protein
MFPLQFGGGAELDVGVGGGHEHGLGHVAAM